MSRRRCRRGPAIRPETELGDEAVGRPGLVRDAVDPDLAVGVVGPVDRRDRVDHRRRPLQVGPADDEVGHADRLVGGGAGVAGSIAGPDDDVGRPGVRQAVDGERRAAHRRVVRPDVAEGLPAVNVSKQRAGERHVVHDRRPAERQAGLRRRSGPASRRPPTGRRRARLRRRLRGVPPLAADDVHTISAVEPDRQRLRPGLDRRRHEPPAWRPTAWSPSSGPPDGSDPTGDAAWTWSMPAFNVAPAATTSSSPPMLRRQPGRTTTPSATR